MKLVATACPTSIGTTHAFSSESQGWMRTRPLDDSVDAPKLRSSRGSTRKRLAPPRANMRRNLLGRWQVYMYTANAPKNSVPVGQRRADSEHM